MKLSYGDKVNKGGLTYGLGASYDINKTFAIRAEYEVLRQGRELRRRRA